MDPSKGLLLPACKAVLLSSPGLNCLTNISLLQGRGRSTRREDALVDLLLYFMDRISAVTHQIS